jgi:hypothetical protein
MAEITMTGQHGVCAYCGHRIEQDEFGGWSATHTTYDSSTYLCPDAPVTPDSGTGMHAPKDTEHIVAADSAELGAVPAKHEAYATSYTITVRTPATEKGLREYLQQGGYTVDDITWNR